LCQFFEWHKDRKFEEVGLLFKLKDLLIIHRNFSFVCVFFLNLIFNKPTLMANFDNEKIQDYLKNGAVVLDVRTQAEFDEGHVANSEHIVLDRIPSNISTVKAYGKPVIAVCRSGARSGQATDFLKQQGIDIINGGPWQNVDQYL
tara:strand:+ start:12470 stop:12904 length:435 start_codon:yes stop_codon:yes gene_type:complete